ncbi:MAG: Rieske (2Fe-2S) protein [Pyrinomonadaceae bacterium]|nr:Rieske (2Fe-2S) protein [Pyrinomonadaceae bacterium]
MADAQSQDREITRRRFCNGLLLTSTGLLFAATTPVSEAAARQEPLLAYPPLRIEGAERLMPGSSLYFVYPRATDPAILVRAEDGQYYAYSQRCSHMGCSIYFERASRRLECPCHKGAFNTQTGFVLNGPPLRPLDLIVLQIRAGGEVWAVGRGVGSTDRKCQRPASAEAVSERVAMRQ